MVEHTARQFTDRCDERAVDVLLEHADLAATQGNSLSIQVWIKIAEAAERLLRR
jgi:hypothetical protein